MKVEPWESWLMHRVRGTQKILLFLDSMETVFRLLQAVFVRSVDSWAPYQTHQTVIDACRGQESVF